jgi:hypothetical protein
MCLCNLSPKTSSFPRCFLIVSEIGSLVVENGGSTTPDVEVVARHFGAPYFPSNAVGLDLIRERKNLYQQSCCCRAMVFRWISPSGWSMLAVRPPSQISVRSKPPMAGGQHRNRAGRVLGGTPRPTITAIVQACPDRRTAGVGRDFAHATSL